MIEKHIEEAEKDVLDIRNLEDLEKYPELVVIRDSIITAYDYLQHIDDIADAKDKSQFFNLLAANLPVPINEDQLYFYELTVLGCRFVQETILSYLKTHANNTFNMYAISAEGHLKYFPDHYMVVLQSKLNKVWFGFSPANIFNLNMTIPTFNGAEFQRSTQILVADTYNELRNKIIKLEGGEWDKGILGRPSFFQYRKTRRGMFMKFRNLPIYYEVLNDWTQRVPEDVPEL